MVNWKSRKLGDILTFANGFIFLVLINLLTSKQFYRLDLTEEKRYSIKSETYKLLQSLEDEVHVEVFLEGKLNSNFQRFQKSILETLEEFKIYSDNKISYSVTDPSLATSEKARTEFMADLSARGIQPTNVIDTRDGKREEKIIFPGVIVSYEGVELGVMLLKGNKAGTPDEEINQSIEGIEYELASAIYNLVNTERKQVGFVYGHGELDSLHSTSFRNDLLETYDVHPVNLDTDKDLKKYDALIIAKPTQAFSELHKFRLDQYVMNGGKILFSVDKLEASMENASRDDYFANPYHLNLDDQLFKYGVRLNPDLVLDRRSGRYPVITGQTDGKPKIQLMEWPFFPLISKFANHPITRNLDAVLSKFSSSIDTVKAIGVKKTPLLMTSPYARTVSAPVHINVNELRKNLRDEDFATPSIPIAFLLEGKFTSLYKNRFAPDSTSPKGQLNESTPTKMVVIADGDMARNEVNPRSNQAQPVGFDPMMNYTFANRDFLLNTLSYLTDEEGLIQARTKQVKIRPLDQVRIQGNRIKWQVINLAAPIVLLITYGVVRLYLRKRRFAKF
jgi:gliding-associated putative ABC transporter substrate-binding component GldG